MAGTAAFPHVDIADTARHGRCCADFALLRTNKPVLRDRSFAETMMVHYSRFNDPGIRIDAPK